jgi:subtilisin-like proprotein convertase family protein
LAQVDAYWYKLDRIDLRDINSGFTEGLAFKLELDALLLPTQRNELSQITLPLPDGQMINFDLIESPIMEAGLQMKFPELKTYQLKNAQYTGRMDIGPLGLNAMFHNNGETFLIDAYQYQGHLIHVSYLKSSFVQNDQPVFSCEIEPASMDPDYFSHPDTKLKGQAKPMGMQLNSVNLRVYRLALACTAEYAQFHGNTLATVMAAMVTAVNRINVLYERDLAIRFVLVNDNDKLIFFDAATDPYNNGNLNQMLGQNQTTLNSIIGVDNYDIGHVFSTNSGGGIAGLAVVCTDSKARGATGRASPVGDPFIIDYVAHEIGHQFGANHTFNNCSGNENFGTAFEPGSGSTIMAYAGLCGNNNIQFNSDDYFHTGSIQEIYQFSRTGFGNSCAQLLPINNHEPEISLPYSGILNIPIRTPFELKANATDPDGDQLTYCWEQMNTGPVVNLGSPAGTSPSFRSIRPQNVPLRTFPAMNNVLNNTSNVREVLPTYGRNLDFRCTVRDNHPGGGAAVWSSVRLVSHQSSGPFQVLEPKLGSVFTAGKFEIIKWDVSATDIEPISCKHVHIILSRDAGLTWTDTLAKSVPNNGEALVWIPLIESQQARIRVNAADNVFFNVNPNLFKIVMPQDATFTGFVSAPVNLQCIPDEIQIPLYSYGLNGFEDPISITLVDDIQIPGMNFRFEKDTLMPGDSSLLILTFDQQIDIPEAIFQLRFESGTDTFDFPFRISLLSKISESAIAQFPLDEAEDLALGLNFEWTPVQFADSYRFLLDTTPKFVNPIVSVSDLSTTQHSPSGQLAVNQIYYWKVEAYNRCADFSTSEIFVFRTLNITCDEINKVDDILISASGLPTISSNIIVDQDMDIQAVEILNIKGNHQSFSDLNFTVIAPDLSEVILVNRRCGPVSTQFHFSFSDFALDAFSCPPNAGRIHIPNQPLSAFVGTPSRGNWQLRIRDTQAGGGGRFTGWGLRLCAGIEMTAPDLINIPLELLPGTARHITNIQLKLSEGAVMAEQFRYVVLDLPKYGELVLNGILIGVGDQFTQSDIDNRRLYYQHLGTEEEVDGFHFLAYRNGGGWTGKRRFDIIMDDDFVSSNINLKLESQSFTIYPNPVTHSVFIQSDNLEASEWVVFDMHRPMAKYKTQDGELPLIDLNNWLPGMYILQRHTFRGVVSKRFVLLE